MEILCKYLNECHMVQENYSAEMLKSAFMLADLKCITVLSVPFHFLLFVIRQNEWRFLLLTWKVNSYLSGHLLLQNGDKVKDE